MERGDHGTRLDESRDRKSHIGSHRMQGQSQLGEGVGVQCPLRRPFVRNFVLMSDFCDLNVF